MPGMHLSLVCGIIQGSIYHQLAAADGVTLDTAGSSKAFCICGLTGDYRRIIHRPKDLEWKLIQYSDANEPLALSELEILAGTALPEAQAQGVVLKGLGSTCSMYLSQRQCRSCIKQRTK